MFILNEEKHSDLATFSINKSLGGSSRFGEAAAEAAEAAVAVLNLGLPGSSSLLLYALLHFHNEIVAYYTKFLTYLDMVNYALNALKILFLSKLILFFFINILECSNWQRPERIY